MEKKTEDELETGCRQGSIEILCEPWFKLLASPLITPILVACIIPYVTILRSVDCGSHVEGACVTDFHLRVYFIYSCKNSGATQLMII